MNLRVPLSAPDIGERELRYVREVLLSGNLSLGPVLRDFEQQFAAMVGRKYAIAVNSGTSALHLCVRALGIGVGDEVITTSFSFVASTNCLLYEGATPVFVDIDPVTLNISVEEIASFLARRCYLDDRGRTIDRETGRVVKAILPVHVFGLPCDMRPISKLAKAHNLSIIEDSCEAIGAMYYGQQAGTFGEASCFAFYPNKQMTTAEGGMIVTDREDLERLCRSMRNQGRGENGSWLRHERIGYNYRLSDIHCALGLAQLERLPELLTKRAAVADAYKAALASQPYLQTLTEPPFVKRSWFVYIVQLSQDVPRGGRDRILERLRAAGIGCQAYFPAIHRQPFVNEAVHIPLGRLRETEIAANRCLALPFFANLRNEQIGEVIRELRAAIAEECEPEKKRPDAQAKSFPPVVTFRENS
jgi:perosamine synthetase